MRREQPPRVCRITAIGEHVFHGLVARNGLILAKSDQQMANAASDGTLADGLGERNEHWVTSRSGVAGIEFLAQTPRSARAHLGRYFIAKIV